MTFRRWILDTFERAAASFVQAAVVFLTTFAAAWNLDAGKALIAAGLQAAAAVLLSAITAPLPIPTTWIVDAVLRIARTFLGTILAAVAAHSFDLFTLDGWRAVIAAALTATLAGFKANVARHGEAGGTTPASWAIWPR